MHLVDPASKQLIHAFLVVTEASLPQISRRLEVSRHNARSIDMHIIGLCPSAWLHNTTLDMQVVRINLVIPRTSVCCATRHVA